MKNLVSIMVPCLNGEEFVCRLFDSILEQSYTRIQVIFVNDGSTDRTEEIVLSYRDSFESKGMKLEYIYQENQGQAAAINTALPYVKGELCMWIDADDFIQPNHVERKLQVLVENPDADVVMCQGVCLRDKDLVYLFPLGKEKAVGTLFEDILLDLRRCTPGLFMVRTRALIECLAGKGIYPSRAGQNMQLLLPVIYTRKTVFVSEQLFCYVMREKSHSRGMQDYFQWKKRWDMVEDVKKVVLASMKEEFSFHYYRKMLKCVEKQIAIKRMESLCETNVDQSDIEYVNDVLRHWLDTDLRTEDRMVYIWGADKRGEIIAELLRTFWGINIVGYIDNNYKNILGAFSPEVLEPSKMYVIIPLLYYDEVLNLLVKKQFKCVDFSYPYATLRELLLHT